MANPFAALGSVPIMQVIQDTLQRSATIRNQQILGDERQQLMQIRAQEMQQEQAFQKALMNTGVTNPDQGKVEDASQDEGILGQMTRQIGGLKQQAERLDALAKTPNISPQRSMDLVKESNALKKTISDESMKVLDERSKVYEKIGDSFGGVKTQEDVDIAQAQARRLDPQTVFTLSPALDTDPSSGRWLATPKTLAVMNKYADRTMSQAKRQQFEMQRQAEADRAQAAQDRLDQRKLEERDRNERAAQAQAGLTESRKAREEAHQDVVSQRVYTQAQTIGNEYKNDDQVKEFASHKKQFLTAYNYVFDQEGKVKPEGAPGTPEWANHDSASDFELSKQFIAVTHPHYRGTTYDAKELRSLANLPEHLANMIAGVAAGKVLAQSDRVNMVNAMKRVIDNENDDQIQREDKALQRVTNLTKGVDVSLPGFDPKDYVTLYAFRPGKEMSAPEKAPTTPAAVQKASTGGSRTPDQIIQDAKNAIAKGANRDAVIKRLRDAGINPAGL